MLKHGLRFFMVFVFTLQSVAAGSKAPTAEQWKAIQAESNDIGINIYLTKFQRVKKPVDLIPEFLSDLSEKERLAAEKMLSRETLVPSISREGQTLLFNLNGQKASLEIIDTAAGKYKINGLNFTLDRQLPLNEVIRYMEERYFKKGYSGLWGLIIPKAEANTIGIALVVLTAVLALGTNIFTVEVCRTRGLSGGACSGVKEERFANKCVSADGKTLRYLVKKTDGTWTEIAATLKGENLVEFTQVCLLEDQSKAQNDKNKKDTKSKSKEKADAKAEFERNLVRKRLPITYTLKDGRLQSVEIPGRMLGPTDLPAKANGEPNEEWFAYEQMKGIVRAMVNYCREHNGDAGEYDAEIIPIAMTIDNFNAQSGATSASKVVAPGKETPEIKTLTEVKKDIKDAKKANPPTGTAK